MTRPGAHGAHVAELIRLRRWLDRCIWIDPERRGGEPCLGGTRIPVNTVLGWIDAGDRDEIHTAYPHLTAEHVAVSEWWRDHAATSELLRLRRTVARVAVGIEAVLEDHPAALPDPNIAELRARLADLRAALNNPDNEGDQT